MSDLSKEPPSAAVTITRPNLPTRDIRVGWRRFFYNVDLDVDVDAHVDDDDANVGVDVDVDVDDDVDLDVDDRVDVDDGGDVILRIAINVRH